MASYVDRVRAEMVVMATKALATTQLQVKACRQEVRCCCQVA